VARRRICAAHPRHPALAVAVIALLLVAPACSKDKADKPAAPKPKATTTSAAAGAAPTLRFTVVGTDDNGTKGPDDATSAAVKQTMDAWLASAVVGPLHSGQPAGDLSALFTQAALDKLADPAVRATLVDEGIPAAKTITADKADLLLTSVAGPDEVVAVIGARIDLKVHTVGGTHDVDVVHQGELVLVPDGAGWKIDSFAVHTARDSRNA
jgi:hypothetical protein